MEDRLLEIKKFSNNTITVSDTSAGLIDKKYTDCVKIIQSFLSSVRYNNDQVRKLKEQHHAATLNEQEKKISQDLNRILTSNQEIMKKTKSLMEELEEIVKTSKEKSPDEPETRIMASSFQALTTKFHEVLKESQAIQGEFRSAVKEKIARQAKMVDDTLTDQQLEDICENPEGAAKIMAARLYGQSPTKLENAVSDIQDKYRDIQKLEESVRMVHQMFVDMAMLVHAQGEMLDSIELNVSASKDYLNKAVKDLDNAKKDHISARKKMIFILVCIAVIAGAIIIPIVISKSE